MKKKCLAIGDLFVPFQAMELGLEPLSQHDIELEVMEFNCGDFDALQRVNHEVEQKGPHVVTLDQALREKMLNADMIVVHFCPVDASLINQNSKLSLIATCRTGLSNIDTQAALQADIKVINCQGRLANAVADFTVGMMICEARNIARGHTGLKNNQWIRRYHNLGHIPDLDERTVGLVGFGAIGQAVAKRLSGFNMRILAYDPYVKPEVALKMNVELVSLEELLKRSDFVSIHTNLCDATRNLIDHSEMALMKSDAYLINTARAGIVNEVALIEALQQNRIAGAAIDVFDKEPPPSNHPFLTLENVTITPHMAGGSDDAFRRSPKLLCQQIIQWLEQG